MKICTESPASDLQPGEFIGTDPRIIFPADGGDGRYVLGFDDQDGKVRRVRISERDMKFIAAAMADYFNWFQDFKSDGRPSETAAIPSR